MTPEGMANFRDLRDLLRPLFANSPNTYSAGCSVKAKPGGPREEGERLLSCLGFGNNVYETIGKPTLIGDDGLGIEMGGQLAVPALTKR